MLSWYQLNSRIRTLPSFSTFNRPLWFLIGACVLGQAFIVQKDLAWTLPVGMFLFAIAAYFFLRLSKTAPVKTPLELSGRSEFLSLAALLALAVFLRLFRLSSFPAGLFPDSGFLGVTVEKMIHEHWYPFKEIFNYLVTCPSIYYSLFIWFHFLEPSQIDLFLYSGLISLLGIVLFYLIDKDLSDARTALIAAFFLGVSRWYLTYSRDAHPAIETVLYLGLTLWAWLFALKTLQTWRFLLCGLFAGIGFYSYPDLKFLPFLLAAYGIYELLQAKNRHRLFLQIVLLFALFLLVASPVWSYLLQNHGFTFREIELAAYPRLIIEQGWWKGLFGHGLDLLLAFNRHGDPWPYHNIPDHRLLDDVTGVLWSLGLIGAISQWKKRNFFYPLAGALIFSLPAFLSIDAQHGSRLLGALPFLFFMGAQALEHLFQLTSSHFSQNSRRAALLFLLLVCAGQNYWDYFEVQAHQVLCWWVQGGAAATWMANIIKEDNKDYTCLLCQKYRNNDQLRFLTYDLNAKIGDWKLPASLDLADVEPGKGACLLFDYGEWGDLDLFEKLYPGGTTGFLVDPQGNPMVCFYRIPPALLPPLAVRAKSALGHGLRAEYYPSSDGTGGPTQVRIDPLLNFTHHDEFALGTPDNFSVRWKGRLNIGKTGNYGLKVRTTEAFQVSLDGKPFLTPNTPAAIMALTKGKHSLEIRFSKVSGYDANFTLLWQEPNGDHWVVIPFSAYDPGLR